MPMDRSKYPADWEETSRRIRFGRAGGRCEKIIPETGRRCPCRHGDRIRRLGGEPWRVEHLPKDSTDGTLVVLTVHHIGTALPDGSPGDARDKMDTRDENLIALCQRCHLLEDLEHHLDQGRRTRDRKRGAVDMIDQLEEREE